MTYLRIGAISAVLAAAFLLGMWVTSPGFPYSANGFPFNRTFVAVSLNGEPVNYERLPYLPTFEVRRSTFSRLRVFGSGGCNRYNGDLTLVSEQSIAWGQTSQTARVCGWGTEFDARYLQALLKTVRWRREEGTLILEDDTDSLRFMLAPR